MFAFDKSFSVSLWTSLWITYPMRTVKDDVVHPQIHLVEETGVEEVAPLWFVVQQAPLNEESLEGRSGKGYICNG